jgi:hypothetical protein
VAMVVIRGTAAGGTLAMLVAVVRAFSLASFGEDGAALLDLAWGQVTLLDLYLALLLGWAWIAWRERSLPRAAVWFVATMVLGSLALFSYLLGASLRAGNPTELALGPRRILADGGAGPRLE